MLANDTAPVPLFLGPLVLSRLKSPLSPTRCETYRVTELPLQQDFRSLAPGVRMLALHGRCIPVGAQGARPPCPAAPALMALALALA